MSQLEWDTHRGPSIYPSYVGTPDGLYRQGTHHKRVMSEDTGLSGQRVPVLHHPHRKGVFPDMESLVFQFVLFDGPIVQRVVLLFPDLLLFTGRTRNWVQRPCWSGWTPRI